ncbi:MAG: hypothetical protein ACOCG5_03780 [Candidatus Alkaliphilus sp. MAG34]
MKKIFLLILMLVLLSSVFTYGDINQIRRQGFVEGYLLESIDDTLEIEGYGGEIYAFSLCPNIIYTIDGYIVDKSNFMPGMEIYAGLQGSTVISIEGYSTSNLGYIPEGSRMKTGRIARIDRNQLVLRLSTGDEETFFTMPHTIILRNGQHTGLDTLYEGDKVKLYFDEYDTNIISRISVEGNSIIVRGLYKAKLGTVDRYSDKINISDIYQLNNGEWEQFSYSFIPQPDYGYNQQLVYGMTLPYNSSSPLYTGGYPVSYDNLKYYGGKTIYLAIKNFFGKDRVERMVVQNQYESTYSDKIKDINWFTEEFELKNNRNIGFNDGTIVIKNDRIVDKFALKAQSDVFVVADGRGANSSAGVIYVLNEDINNSNIGQHYIYAGRMDQIVEDRLWLRDFFLLDENEWQSFRGKKELFFDNDTDIYDLDKEGRRISIEEFYSGIYAIDENSKHARKNNLKDWHAYIYTDGDRISALMAQENMDSLLKQRVTNGLVSSVINDNFVGWKIRLTNACDWSNAKSQWMGKSADLDVCLEKALLIKNGRQIEPCDLKSGDRVYLVRDDYYAKVLIVK